MRKAEEHYKNKLKEKEENQQKSEDCKQEEQKENIKWTLYINNNTI